MFGLIFFSLLLLVISDPLIRVREDSKLKRIWVNFFKEPLTDIISRNVNSFYEMMIKNLRSNDPKKVIDPNKLIVKLSKYTYYILSFALILLLIAIIRIFI